MKKFSHFTKKKFRQNGRKKFLPSLWAVYTCKIFCGHEYLKLIRNVIKKLDEGKEEIGGTNNELCAGKWTEGTKDFFY